MWRRSAGAEFVRIRLRKGRTRCLTIQQRRNRRRCAASTPPTFPALLRAAGHLAAGHAPTRRASWCCSAPTASMLNTHFRDFSKPMGMAVDGDRLAVGTAPGDLAVSQRAGRCAGRWSRPAGTTPASCRARGPRHRRHRRSTRWPGHSRTTELWFVNTRFSCLCTLSDIHSFVPRWRPPFITALAPEDRCHLNGLGLAPMATGPRYVTALGATDTPRGWRRAQEGRRRPAWTCPAASDPRRGLSMPHSPRWHNGQLWLLESGTGGIGIVDPAAAATSAIAELPGFTRGLDFYGNAGLHRPVAGARDRRLQRHPHRRAGRWRSATAASGWWTSARAKPWRS